MSATPRYSSLHHNLLHSIGFTTRTINVFDLFKIGKGHGSDKAVIPGLMGEKPKPESTDTLAIDSKLASVHRDKKLLLLGEQQIDFDESSHLIMHRRKSLPYHPNGKRFSAVDVSGDEICTTAFYSVGGGFVIDETAADSNPVTEDSSAVAYPSHKGGTVRAMPRNRPVSLQPDA